jgi:WhiB family redox-sensing transcriptional regulator
MSSTIDSYAWMDRAECRDMDLSEHDPFDPPVGKGRGGDIVREALAICGRCEVREECLSDALRQRDVYGIKGGTTGPEREAILMGRRTSKKSGAERRKEQGIKKPPRTEAEKIARKARDQARVAAKKEQEAAELVEDVVTEPVAVEEYELSVA